MDARAAGVVPPHVYFTYWYIRSTRDMDKIDYCIHMYVARTRWMLERQLSVASVQSASDKPCSRHSFSEALAPLTPSRCGPCSSSFSSTEACRRSPPGLSGWPWSKTQRLQTPEPSPPTSRPFSCRVGAESHGLSRFAALTGVGSSVWTCCREFASLHVM